MKTDEETALLPEDSSASDEKEYVPPPMSPWLRFRTWLIQRVNLILFSIPGVRRIANRFYTNRAASTGDNRPHALSCKSDYTSWESLTDYSYYGRHLEPAEPGYQESLPSIDDVVEIFRRIDGIQTICPKSTMLFPTFAQHLIDSFIVTKTKFKPPSSSAPTEFLWEETRTNHDIGLIPLYGRTYQQTTALRLKSDTEKGKLKYQLIDGEEWPPFLYKDGSGKELSDPEFKVLDEPQGLKHFMSVDPNKQGVKEKVAAIFAFGGERTNTTPQIAALNTLLLREHNRVAVKVAEENPTWDDERVFQTTRNIVLVQYLKIVIEEYINHITSAGITFKVDPREWVWNAPWYKRNWITAEFAVLYRWHALVTNSVTFGGTQVKTEETVFDNRLILNKGQSLRDIFVEISNDNKATVQQCFNTADWMLRREKASLIQGRECNLKPFTDYMEYLGEPRPKTFADISGYPAVQQKLEELYGTPDRVEFYVGLIASDLPPKYVFSTPLTLLVANDAFSQALTNPLLSENVFNETTFGPYGWKLIQEDVNINKLVERNTNGGQPLEDFVGMTRQDWSL